MKEKITSLIFSGFIFTMLFAGFATAAHDEQATPDEEAAVPASAPVMVNGEQVRFGAYIINGYSYFKLRDLAFVLSGTAKQFDVGWDAERQVIRLIPGEPYTPVGGELETGNQVQERQAVRTPALIYKDEQPLNLVAYNIGGYNYFMLRDIGCAFDFEVSWHVIHHFIGIYTDSPYIDDMGTCASESEDGKESKSVEPAPVLIESGIEQTRVKDGFADVIVDQEKLPASVKDYTHIAVQFAIFDHSLDPLIANEFDYEWFIENRTAKPDDGLSIHEYEYEVPIFIAKPEGPLEENWLETLRRPVYALVVLFEDERPLGFYKFTVETQQ